MSDQTNNLTESTKSRRRRHKGTHPVPNDESETSDGLCELVEPKIQKSASSMKFSTSAHSKTRKHKTRKREPKGVRSVGRKDGEKIHVDRIVAERKKLQTPKSPRRHTDRSPRRGSRDRSGSETRKKRRHHHKKTFFEFVGCDSQEIIE
eukprot:TRINITY_DN358_c0_g3_i1.p1 TRINITY_DN358_c0_g3~~TRINITY_DN358_c0_g3_i1.p1  ORF type:complete len:149 (-),score=30.16 TRINITY_DN358_c0_g3_i1:175-621(-)